MRIRDFVPPNSQEIPGMPKDARWVQAYMAPVFEHLKLLTQAAQGKLSSDNLNEDTKTISVRHGIPVEITTKVKGRPLGASLLAFTSPCIISEAQPIDIGKIRLAVEFDDSSPDERVVTVLVKGS